MKIVDRETFLGLPAGTIYAKFEPHVIGHPCIKGATMGNDWVVQDLTPSFEGVNDCEAYFEVIDAMMAGKASPPTDYDFNGRDGLFDRDQQFAIWNGEDARRLVATLKGALDLGYPEPAETDVPAETDPGARLREHLDAGERLDLISGDDLRALLGRLDAAEKARDEAEGFLDAAVSTAPEPLVALGAYLAELLNEDQWATAERFLNGALVSVARATALQTKCGR